MILGNRTVTRRRVAAGSYGSTGRWTDGATSDTTDTAATWRPIRPHEAQFLEEGQRSMSPHVLTSSLDYRTAEASGAKADVVIVDAVSYTVVGVHKSQSGILSHYKAICVRQGET